MCILILEWGIIDLKLDSFASAAFNLFFSSPFILRFQVIMWSVILLLYNTSKKTIMNVCENREANTLETQLIWYRKCLSLTNCNHFSIPAIVSASFIFGSPSFLQTAPSLSPAAPSFLSRHPLNCRVWVALCRCILPYLPAATAGLMHCRHDASTIYNDPSKWVINFPSG